VKKATEAQRGKNKRKGDRGIQRRQGDNQNGKNPGQGKAAVEIGISPHPLRISISPFLGGFLARHLLLTGVPGVGKTTVLRKVAERLAGVELGGFLTDEIRIEGKRVGFAIETFDGDSATLAHVDIHSRYRVGRYRVDVEALDRIVERTLCADKRDVVYLVDEIGKMECFSRAFIDAVSRLLDSHGVIVATIAGKGGGFIEQVKGRPDVELWEVTQANRDDLPLRIQERLSPKPFASQRDIHIARDR
jgi:nucleoside-triphosphatase